MRWPSLACLTWPGSKGAIIWCCSAMRRIQRSDLMDMELGDRNGEWAGLVAGGGLSPGNGSFVIDAGAGREWPAEMADDGPGEQHVLLLRAGADVVDHQRPARAVRGKAVGDQADMRQAV